MRRSSSTTGPTWATRWSCTTDARRALLITCRAAPTPVVQRRQPLSTEGGPEPRGSGPLLCPCPCLCLCLWPRWCSGRRLILLWGRAALCARGRRPAREIATREPDGSEWSISKPVQAPPPPPGAAAWPSVFSGALHAGGACGSGVSGPRHRLWAPLPGPAVSPVPSMPAVPVVLVCPARPRHRLRALQPGPPVPPQRRHRGTTSGLECRREARLGLTAAYTHPYGFR